MKKIYYQLAGMVLAIGSVLSPSAAYALTETENYSETFGGITDASASDFAPQYWLHNVDKGSSTDPWYAVQETGGHDGGAYIQTTGDCNPYYTTYDCLVTPPVKGAVSFWVKGGALEIYEMSVSNGSLEKGNRISNPADFTISSSEWRQVNLDLEDYKRLGIVIRATYNKYEGGIDDFTASSADFDPVLCFTISDMTFDSKAIADGEGNATINVSFNVSNKGSADIDFSNIDFTFGKLDWQDNIIVEYCKLNSSVGLLTPGKSEVFSFKVPYKLADPSVSESRINLGVKNGYNDKIIKLGYVDIVSVAGVFLLKNGTTEVTADSYVEAGYHTGAFTLSLSGSNKGESDITISEVNFDGTLDGTVTFTTPFTLAKGANGEEMAFVFDATPGAKTGTVTIKYSNGIKDDCSFKFELGGATLADGGWIEDFNSLGANTKLEPGSMPLSGWRVESQYFMANKTGNNVQLNSTQYNTSTIITPMVKIEKEGQLSLYGGRQNVADSHDKVLVISISKDRENWEELGGVVAKLGTGRTPFNTFEAPAKANEMRWFNFSFKNFESGNYYIKFEAQPFSLDNIFGVTPVDPAHDFILESISAPASGEVNKLFTASVEITNMRGASDDEYVVTLFEGETPVARTEGVEIEEYGKATVTLSYMPHNAGEVTLHAVVDVAEGYKVMTSSDVTVNIAQEECVGKSEMTIDSYKSDALLIGKENKIQFYIPADLIALASGTEISEIEFSVYNSVTNNSVTVPYSLWVEEVDANSSFGDEDKVDFDLPDEENATVGEYVLESGVSSQNSPAKFIIPLNKPVTYTGKPLMVTMQVNLTSAIYSFYVGTHNCKGMFRYYYFISNYMKGAGSKDYIPAVTLRYALEAATVSGRIINKGEAQEGLTVVLTETEVAPAAAPAKAQAQVSPNAAKVAYSGVTDAEGRFSIPVVKNERTYELTVEALGEKYTHPTPVKPTDHIELNDVDVSDALTGIASVDAAEVMLTVSGSALTVTGADAEVYNAAGMLVGVAHDGQALALQSGMYIVRIAGTAASHKIVIR